MPRSGACQDAGGLDLDEAYAALGLDRGATDRQVLLRYRELALKNHPDKGGSEAEFIRTRLAYETITSGQNGRQEREGGGRTEQDPLVSMVLDLAMRLIAFINEQSWSGFWKAVAMFLVGVGGALAVYALADRSGEQGQ